jgi:hypothetical protein
MSIPNPKHKIISGCWKEVNGKVKWREFLDRFGDNYKEYSPEDIENIYRDVNFKLVFVRETSDPDKFNGKIKRFFAQDVHAYLNERVDDSIVIIFEPKAKTFFLRDLKELGQCFALPIESDSCVIVEKSEPYLITKTQALSFLAQWNYGFGKVEVSANGQIEYYKTV